MHALGFFFGLPLYPFLKEEGGTEWRVRGIAVCVHNEFGAACKGTERGNSCRAGNHPDESLNQ